VRLLENKDVRVATAAASILIHAATPMLQHPPKKDDKEEEEEEEEDLATKLKPLLLQLVSCGTPKAAKVAIRCCLLPWAAQYNTWLLIKLTPKGIVFSFLFFSFLLSA